MSWERLCNLLSAPSWLNTALPIHPLFFILNNDFIFIREIIRFAVGGQARKNMFSAPSGRPLWCPWGVLEAQGGHSFTFTSVGFLLTEAEQCWKVIFILKQILAVTHEACALGMVCPCLCSFLPYGCYGQAEFSGTMSLLGLPVAWETLGKGISGAQKGSVVQKQFTVFLFDLTSRLIVWNNHWTPMALSTDYVIWQSQCLSVWLGDTCGQIWLVIQLLMICCQTKFKYLVIKDLKKYVEDIIGTTDGIWIWTVR